MNDFIRKIFESKSEVSSKRVCGFIGWIVCNILVIYCSITNKEAPDIAEILMFCSLSLLGLDSITSIFKTKISNRKSSK